MLPVVGVETGAGDETTGTRVVGTTTGATVVVGFTTTGAGVFDVVVDVVLLVCSMKTAGACVLMGIGVLLLEVVAGAGIRTGTPWDVTVATSTGAPVEKEVP